MIVYEYPFNERIRTLLRLEDLYEKFVFFLHQESPHQHHIALATIFEMLEVAGRADLKSDLLQELERQKQILLAYQSNPNVEPEMLNAILAEVDQASSALSAAQGKTGQNIRDNEWLMSIRGRTIIPGGACEFDLPAYYAWQQHPFERRFQDISNWFAPLIPLFDAIAIVMRLLRESGHAVKINAEGGSYQQMLQGKVYQMLRLSLDINLGAIPEISANKYMLWVRFTQQDGDEKPRSFEGEVPFELALCGFGSVIGIEGSEVKRMATIVDCPTCGTKVEWSEKNKYRPFCSERCKQIDLGAWAEEKYTIPAVNLPLEDEGDKPVQGGRAFSFISP